MNMKKFINVAAGVLFDSENRILFCSRQMPDGSLKWEFPGGKIEPGESAAKAAEREFAEELALEIYPADTMYITEYSYPDKNVRLYFVRCFCFDISTMKMLDGQQFKWELPEKINADEMLAADREFLDFLKLRTIKSCEKRIM